MNEQELQQQLAMAYRENMALQEMLAHVLSIHGKPVYINKEDLAGGKFEGKRIDIRDDVQAERFVISLVDDDNV
jgi:hypothetical protein